MHTHTKKRETAVLWEWRPASRKAVAKAAGKKKKKLILIAKGSRKEISRRLAVLAITSVQWQRPNFLPYTLHV